MSKRKQKTPATPASKKKCTGSVQLSIKNFFKPVVTSEEGDQPVPTTSSQIVVIPQYYEIHIYSDAEIDKAVGLQKQFKTVWNEKAREICSDKTH